jgi:membrane-associated protein
MDLIKTAIDWILHLDKHLVDLVAWAGPWSYAVLFLIVFAETGLVVTPFLPGDSLLFACGALAALEGSILDPWLLGILLFVAAVIGDTVNYWVGSYVGAKVFEKEHRFIKREHLEKTQKFYEKYGAKTIVIARFVPIVRTFAPFVAGVGSMNYKTFLTYNVVGAALWVGLFVPAGVFFGNLPIVRKNFTLVILAIIVLSILPIVFEYVKAKREAKAQGNESPER